MPWRSKLRKGGLNWAALAQCESGGRTKTNIRLLDQRASTHEVARMLSGAELTETSLRHAEQMLKTSRQFAKAKS